MQQECLFAADNAVSVPESIEQKQRKLRAAQDKYHDDKNPEERAGQQRAFGISFFAKQVHREKIRKHYDDSNIENEANVSRFGYAARIVGKF